ncbi:TraB/GumN family protein [Sphingomonas sp. G-3-2-10]|uniref:TraB/GumN family protein n=1 Tax=Sphingomonas sp. G-3-2-10 TaxID=2728838 RepID=UPI00146EE93F|nr:TraB/GumN family protein [Sphingomonas sp. G-3-2-10]NML06074.1 TraB/GumN family protein [Sphingomonas sp. G-3-2-10]
MGRIGRPGGRNWSVCWALAGLFLVSTAGVAQDAPAVPTLPYTAFSHDERLTLAGKLVRPESEEKQDRAVRAEMARIAKAQNYVVRPAIWKISDSDTTIYIFGTVHSLPPGFRWRNPGLEAVIVRADSLLLESTDEDDDVTFLEGLPEGDATLPPLLDRVSHRYRGKLAALQGELPPETVAIMDKMPSWIAAIGIGYIRDMLMGDIQSQGADDWLEKHFRATGRPVEAIENSKSVMANINAIPERAQRMMLEGALAAPDRTHDELDRPAHAWAQGDVGPDSPLRIFPEQLDPSQAMADPLLTQRNIAWVEDLIGRLKKKPGTILFAAGAGHFVGPESVIDLLQKRGVKVERVQ